MFIIIIVLGFLMLLCITWTVHISQVKDERCPYGYAGYKDFIREFNKSKLEKSNMWDWSMFSKDRSDYYHAEIIKFGGKGMIIRNPIELCMVKIFMRRQCRANRIQEKISWRE